MLIPRHSFYRDLLADFESKFHHAIKRSCAQAFAGRRRLYLVSNAVRWSEHPEYDRFLLSFVPNHSEREIIAEFESRFGIKLTKAQLGNRKQKLGIIQGTVGGRFAPGNVPANKGKRMSEYVKDEEKLANIRRTQFVKGQESHNELPVGTERVTRDGYIEVKVDKSRERVTHKKWVHKHRLIWEDAHGRMLEKGEGVMFADGDKRNFDLDNLVLVTNSERLYINQNNIPYHDADSLRAAVSLAKLNGRIAQIEKRPRVCKCCGVKFKPEYKGQVNCRSCIDSGKSFNNRTYGIGCCEKCGARYTRHGARSK